jgi:hypothetical protein
MEVILSPKAPSFPTFAIHPPGNIRCLQGEHARELYIEYIYRTTGLDTHSKNQTMSVFTEANRKAFEYSPSLSQPPPDLKLTTVPAT